MPTFEYQAQGVDGQVVKGHVIGTSLDQAVSDLSGRGLQILNIGVASSAADPLSQSPKLISNAQQGPPAHLEPAPNAPLQVTESSRLESSVVSDSTRRPAPPVDERSYFATRVAGPLVGKVPLTQVAFFFRQFGTMMHAGVPMVQSLNTLGNQAGSAKLKTIVLEMSGHVQAGRPVSAGLQRYPEVFSPIIVSLVRAGEEGGFLDEALAMSADYLDQEIKIRNLYKKTTFWPKLELAASVVIITIANVILGAVGGSPLWSPLTTPSTWIWFGPLVVAIFLFIRVGLANGMLKHYWDQVTSNLPYVGKTLRHFAMAKFGRAFSAMHRAGVPMTSSLKLAADACGNEHLRALMYPAIRRLESGAGISETLRGTGAFSEIVLDMVSTGETTGNLDDMLGKMADFYEGEAEVRSEQMGHVVGVVLFLCVAIYIAVVLINFYGGYASGVMKSGG